MNKKKFFQNAGLFSASLIITLLIVEIFLRFMPVNEGFNFEPVNAQNPVFHARPSQTVIASKEWDLYNARKININNFGFRNDQNYTQDNQSPLIAVIGDSYIEAIQVDYEDTFFGKLAQNLKDKASVYSFGFSGAPLSQYLIWARSAVQEFKADQLTFVIVSNDFDESLGWWRRTAGFHQYERCNTDEYCLERLDYQANAFRTIIKSSALARYMIYNLQILNVVQKLKLKNSAQDFVGNAPTRVNEQRLEDSKLAIDLFFRDLPSYVSLSPQHINFVIDGRTYEDSDTSFDESYFGQMRDYFIKQARARGYNVIDMKPIFRSHFLQNNERFDLPRDGHWNALGHKIVAHELVRYYNAKL